MTSFQSDRAEPEGMRGKWALLFSGRSKVGCKSKNSGLMPTLDTGGEVENDALFERACVHSEREK
jgi:hypothetical protein